MTIAQINNIFLLVGCGCLAYFFYLVFQEIYEFNKPLFPKKKKKQKAKVIPLRRGYVKQVRSC